MSRFRYYRSQSNAKGEEDRQEQLEDQRHAQRVAMGMQVGGMVGKGLLNMREANYEKSQQDLSKLAGIDEAGVAGIKPGTNLYTEKEGKGFEGFKSWATGKTSEMNPDVLAHLESQASPENTMFDQVTGLYGSTAAEAYKGQGFDSPGEKAKKAHLDRMDQTKPDSDAPVPENTFSDDEVYGPDGNLMEGVSQEQNLKSLQDASSGGTQATTLQTEGPGSSYQEGPNKHLEAVGAKIEDNKLRESVAERYGAYPGDPSTKDPLTDEFLSSSIKDPLKGPADVALDRGRESAFSTALEGSPEPMEFRRDIPVDTNTGLKPNPVPQIEIQQNQAETKAFNQQSAQQDMIVGQDQGSIAASKIPVADDVIVKGKTSADIISGNDASQEDIMKRMEEATARLAKNQSIEVPGGSKPDEMLDKTSTAPPAAETAESTKNVDTISANIQKNTQKSLADKALSGAASAYKTGTEVTGAISNVKTLTSGKATDEQKAGAAADLAKKGADKVKEKIAKKAAEKAAVEGAKTAGTSALSTGANVVGGVAAGVTGAITAKSQAENAKDAWKRGDTDEAVASTVAATGGAVAGIGGLLTGVGAVLTATGVGAVVGAPMMAVGGAMTTYGGIAATAGSMYNLAENALEGAPKPKIPDLGRGLASKGSKGLGQSKGIGRGIGRNIGRA